MATLRVVALFDTKAKAFMLPQYFQTTALAKRAVAAAVNDPEAGFLHKNPEDFILFHIADWNDETGKFETMPQPDNLGMCATFINTNSRQPALNWENPNV